MSKWRICSDDRSNYYWEDIGSVSPSKLDDDPKGTPITPYPSMVDLLLEGSSKLIENDNRGVDKYPMFRTEFVDKYPMFRTEFGNSVALKESSIAKAVSILNEDDVASTVTSSGSSLSVLSEALKCAKSLLGEPEVARETKESLRAIEANPTENFDVGAILPLQLNSQWEATRIEALNWILTLLNRYRAETASTPLFTTSIMWPNCFNIDCATITLILLSSTSRILGIEVDSQRVLVNITQTRGRTTLKELYQLPPEHRVKVSRNDAGQPIGPESRLLAGYLGIVRCNVNLLPINYESWREMPNSNKNQALDFVKEKFSLEVSDDYVKQTYQWEDAVRFWSSQKGQTREHIGVASRQQQKFTHTAGSKSFACIAHEEENTSGSKVGRIQLFDMTHTKKDGTPMTADAAEITEKLREKKAEYHVTASSQVYRLKEKLAEMDQQMANLKAENEAREAAEAARAAGEVEKEATTAQREAAAAQREAAYQQICEEFEK
ncbi:hypothetical protein F3Y22_tig00005566pilonHSYRG00016 [Hibiscus syriacus]|uniref:Uncharacterized protein n=1 Tax=Hibiscus syriacus TaxID=106335 RepID=A0A6A3CF11_HIBSY|nr:hypothetical protein F3Y22_tig00005566pilonHSYRG00016 [Hibiscus syriacus]